MHERTWQVVWWMVAAWQLAPANQTAAQYGAKARVSRSVTATNDVDPTASGTQVELHERAQAMEQLSDVVREVPGLRVVTTGAYGSFSGLSLRGAELGHTTVLLGELPISSADRGAFDFSTLPLAWFERIEVYRGGAPAWLSQDAIGGVVRLVPRRARQDDVSLTLGAGSFDLYRASASAAVVTDVVGLYSHAGVTDSDGDFPFVNDDTSLVAGDERQDRRRNAQTTDANYALHAEVDALGGTLSAALLGFSRVGGVVGPASRPALRTRRRQARLYAVTGWSYERQAFERASAHRFELQLGSAYEQHRFVDRFSEIGTTGAQATDDRFVDGFVRTAASLALLPSLDAALIGTYRLQGIDRENELAASQPPASLRRRAALTFEPRLHGEIAGVPYELRPSVRVQQVGGTVAGERRSTLVSQALDDTSFGYRVGAVAEPVRGLAVGASWATGTRLPSVLELFGDEGFLLPNPMLEPERSRVLDVSLVLERALGALRVSAELRGFYAWIEDLIRYRRTSQFTAIATNLDSGRVRGVEAGLDLAFGRHLGLVSAATWMDTRNQRDRALPLRPRLQGYVRPEAHIALDSDLLQRLTVFADLTHVGRNYLDDWERTSLNARSWFSAGVALSALSRRLRLRARVSNAFGVRFDGEGANTDVLGFPLPGRAFFVSATWRQGEGI